ncbi:thymidylate synthase [Capsulimonas corticalis]|uniref:Thymidylate synthase n=1 Tax=Capsulimonas corticalis TaxID=2219043 RepID=A0A402CV16_9BACT|nr:FAD-dependent thymidylate synthase [Capsulimonas corticalis]BDI30286.1 thymidylate synthase [Capsulimonas corticalis]
MTEIFSPEERAALTPYVTNMDGSIFALRNLPEEVVAVLFAYYSRSKDSLRRNLLKLLQEGDLDLTGAGGAAPALDETDGDALAAARQKARTFHEKWVVGYGHSSVAEHGCVHLAIEDVSIIASKLIEDGRLASYTEKSTRYVAFDIHKMYVPPALSQHPELAEEYRGTLAALLSAYSGWTDDIVAQIKSRVPKTEKQTDRGYDSACRASAFDILRYLLPAATYTNIGLTLNARSLETLITKLLSQPLPEGRAIGERLKSEAQHIVPTLLKYADHSAYREETEKSVAAIAAELGFDTLEQAPLRSGVTLIDADPDADDRLVAAILYGAVDAPMSQVLPKVKSLDQETKERIVDVYLKGRGKHDAPGRALERIDCTVEITMDYGAYRDVQRHRIATQTTQALSPALGYETPPEITRFGYADQYDALMGRAAATYARMVAAGLVDEAQYILPLGTRVRALFTWNLRSVTHFVELRSARQGHPSYRKIAQQVYTAVAEAYPLVARYLRPNMNEYALTRD